MNVKRYGLLAAACLLVVIFIDLLTNDLNTTYYFWDFALYIDMAEHGLRGNHDLWAPFAYRFITPLLAGSIADIFSLSTWNGFKVVAYAGAVAQLAAVFALAEYVGAKVWQAAVAVLTVAFSLYNIKFLIFDVTRPDHLAYPLMIAALLALFERRWWLCLVFSCVGLLVREFLIIPPILLLVTLVRQYWAARSRHTLFQMAVVVVAISLCVIVPRALIPIQGSGQTFDPIHHPDVMKQITEPWTSERHLVNMAFNLISYMLPVLLLLTVWRVRTLWGRLARWRSLLMLYSALVLLLAMYGGTDIWRFMTYLFVPLVIVLVALLGEDISPAEILYMLAAVFLYNKIAQPIPNLHADYLDFYGGYDVRVNVITLVRLYEIAAYLAGAVLLRGLLGLARRGWIIRGQPVKRRGVSH